jgi:hypothetical protein
MSLEDELEMIEAMEDALWGEAELTELSFERTEWSGEYAAI